MSAIITFTPRRTSASAIAKPMPLVPPVTTATCPVSILMPVSPFAAVTRRSCAADHYDTCPHYTMHMPEAIPRKSRWYSSLFLQLLVAIVADIAVGWLGPAFAADLKPLADGFIKLIKMLIAPIIFCTVVIGIAHVGDLKSVGRIGVKALIYFELVTTFALLFGLVVGNVVQPGIGFNIDPQTLAIAVLFRLALAKLGEHSPPIVFRVVEQTSHAFFTIVGWVMKLAPLGAFGAMAHIIGQYGIGSLSSYGMLIACCYLAALLFIGILAAISWFFAGINL